MSRSPLSAVLRVDYGGRPQLIAATDHKGGSWLAAIQAGPFVIDPGGTIGVTAAASGRAKRTILAMTEGGDYVVVSTSDASLFETAKVLADAPRLIGCRPIDRAMNLDGGPSTTLLLQGEAAVRSSGGPVRNYLLFSPKP